MTPTLIGQKSDFICQNIFLALKNTLPGGSGSNYFEFLLASNKICRQHDRMWHCNKNCIAFHMVKCKHNKFLKVSTGYNAMVGQNMFWSCHVYEMCPSITLRPMSVFSCPPQFFFDKVKSVFFRYQKKTSVNHHSRAKFHTYFKQCKLRSL